MSDGACTVLKARRFKKNRGGDIYIQAYMKIIWGEGTLRNDALASGFGEWSEIAGRWSYFVVT